jgi:hypothetical protein
MQLGSVLLCLLPTYCSLSFYPFHAGLQSRHPDVHDEIFKILFLYSV